MANSNAVYAKKRRRLEFDIEVYWDYFLISFFDAETGKFKDFEMYEGKPLDRASISRIMRNFTLISFNGNNFDINILLLALREHTTNAELKEMANYIIGDDENNGHQFWETRRHYKLRLPPYLDHIDMKEIMPGQKSLKNYGGQMHSRKIQDLPIHHNALIAPNQRPLMREYCHNDCETLHDAVVKFAENIDIRYTMSQEYDIDLRSKSDAQIAEAVIIAEIERITEEPVEKPIIRPGTQFKYVMPEFIEFETEEMLEVKRRVEESVFLVNHSTGKVIMPPLLAKYKIKFDGAAYTFGIGGLHSNEKKVSYYADEDFGLTDIDMTSFYPWIIRILRLFPSHLGKIFLRIFNKILDDRVHAKKAGLKILAAMLKIVVNGSFGKFGSKYSKLGSPHLLIQVTVTGQLLLLMLIERLTLAGMQVVSANTDGIVVLHRRDQVLLMNEIVWDFETDTKLLSEQTHYKSIHFRDVNAYIAITTSGKVKTKGCFAPPEPVGSSWPSPSNEICSDAVVAYLKDGTPLMDTISACEDVRKFVTIKKVSGGGDFRGEDIGRVARWYYSSESTDSVTVIDSGNQVQKANNVELLMELPIDNRIPADLDYDRYFEMADEYLYDIGVKKRHARTRNRKTSVGSL